MTVPSGEKMAEEVAVAEVGEDVVNDGAGTADGTAAVDAVADARWEKLQVTFVDDPRASVAEAASLAGEAVEAFITTVREQQASLASSWQAQDADTERLRVAFREYRTFWNSVTELSQSG
jgi:hypothetical protein